MTLPPSTPLHPPTTPPPTHPPAADLAAAMQGFQQQMGAAQQPQRVVPLQNIVTSEEVMASGVLGDEEVQKILIDMLPVEAQNPAELEATVRSPQFRQTLASLTNALQTENYNSIFANFSLDTSAGAAALAQGNNVEAFLQAIEAQARAAADAAGEGKSGDEKTGP
mmetsp:Transcript_31914/g.73739  ORF Transcript_31914/g.73739 Transcript_31914/m.73739 type:complete len:166 (+) Transcript_31914:77-574(+)